MPAKWVCTSGNCCDLGDVFDELSVLCSFVDCNILAIEYPSYGLAEACKGSLSMPQCIDTWARAAFEFLLQAGAAPENVIIFGRSIGTGQIRSPEAPAPSGRLDGEFEKRL